MRLNKRILPEKTNDLLVGRILKNIGIVNQKQIEKALEYQKELGEIKLKNVICIQERINIKTINFFLDKWGKIEQKGHQFPIGYYLQQAFLLDKQQIQVVLEEQKTKQVKFGDIAVKKGWVTRKIINSFLDNLSTYTAQPISLK